MTSELLEAIAINNNSIELITSRDKGYIKPSLRTLEQDQELWQSLTKGQSQSTLNDSSTVTVDQLVEQCS